MHITIRLASADDLETLLRFEQGVIAAERPYDPTLRPDPIHYYELPDMLQNPLVDLVVAEHEGRLVGSGYARVEAAKPYADHTSYAYLGFMYVDAAYRGLGINAMILEKLTSLAGARGIGELRLEVYAGNESAIRAYEKAGFTPLMITMRMPVDNAILSQ